MPVHLNSLNVESYGFKLAADGLPELADFQEKDAYKYTFMDGENNIYLLKLINDSVSWVKVGQKGESDKTKQISEKESKQEQKKSPEKSSRRSSRRSSRKSSRRSSRKRRSSRRKSSRKKSSRKVKRKSFKFQKRTSDDKEVVEPSPEEILEQPSILDQPLEIKQVEPRRRPYIPQRSSPTVDELFEDSVLPTPTESSINMFDSKQNESQEDTDELIDESDIVDDQEELGVQVNRRLKNLVYQLLFGPPPPAPPSTSLTSPQPSTSFSASKSLCPKLPDGTVQVCLDSACTKCGPQKQEDAKKQDPPTPPPLPPSTSQQADPLEAELADQDKKAEEEDFLQELNNVEQVLIKEYSPVIVACIAKFNYYRNNVINYYLENNPKFNNDPVKKNLKFNYDLVVTGGTAINFHYPNTTQTVDFDLKLVVPAKHYKKKYYKLSNITDEQFKQVRDQHINEMNNIANLTRMKLAQDIEKCLQQAINQIKVPDKISNPKIVTKVIGIVNGDPTKLVNAKFYNKTVQTAYGPIVNATLIQDPKKLNTQVSITSKKMIKIVLEYNYKGKTNDLELIDLGMFAKTPTQRYFSKNYPPAPTGYGSSFGHLLYDFFLDQTLGLGPNVNTSSPYIKEGWKEYSVIPFVKYGLKDGPMKDRNIKFSNLHRLVQNNLIMQLITIDEIKNKMPGVTDKKLEKYANRFDKILRKIEKDKFPTPSNYDSISTIVGNIRKRGSEVIKEYKEKWVDKNFICRYRKQGNRSFYFIEPDINNNSCKDYSSDLNNSQFQKSLNAVFQEIGKLPWSSTDPKIPQKISSEAAQINNIGSFK